MDRTPREWEGLVVEATVSRWDVVGVWSLEVKIVVHQSRRIGVLGRSWVWFLGGCFDLVVGRYILKTHFENVWICWMERSGDDGCEGGNIVEGRLSDGERSRWWLHCG